MTTNEAAARNLLAHIDDEHELAWRLAWDEYHDAEALEHIHVQEQKAA